MTSVSLYLFGKPKTMFYGCELLCSEKALFSCIRRLGVFYKNVQHLYPGNKIPLELETVAPKEDCLHFMTIFGLINCRTQLICGG